MNKEFFAWNKLKIFLDGKNRRVFFREREIWLTYLGRNVGYEQNGSGKEFLRPVLIIRKFSREAFLSVPLTKSIKKGKFYFSFQFKKDVISTAILSQIRLLDAKRLKYRIGYIDKENFLLLIQKTKRLLG